MSGFSVTGGGKPVILPSIDANRVIQQNAKNIQNSKEKEDNILNLDGKAWQDLDKQNMDKVENIIIGKIVIDIKNMPKEERSEFLSYLKDNFNSKKIGDDAKLSNFISMTTDGKISVKGKENIETNKVDLIGEETKDIPKGITPLKMSSNSFDKEKLMSAVNDTRKVLNDKSYPGAFTIELYIEKDGKVFKSKMTKDEIKKLQSGEKSDLSVMINKKELPESIKDINLGLYDIMKGASNIGNPVSDKTKREQVIKVLESNGIKFEDGIDEDELSKVMEYVAVEKFNMSLNGIPEEDKNQFNHFVSKAINDKLGKISDANGDNKESQFYKNAAAFLSANGIDDKEIKSAGKLTQRITLSPDKNDPESLVGKMSVSGETKNKLQLKEKTFLMGKPLTVTGDNGSTACGTSAKKEGGNLREVTVLVPKMVSTRLTESEKLGLNFIQNSSEIFKVNSVHNIEDFNLNLAENFENNRTNSYNPIQQDAKDKFNNLITNKPDTKIKIKVEGDRGFLAEGMTKDNCKDPEILKSQRSIKGAYSKDDETFNIIGTASVSPGSGFFAKNDVPNGLKKYIKTSDIEILSSSEGNKKIGNVNKDNWTPVNNDYLGLLRAVDGYKQLVENFKGTPEEKESLKNKLVVFELNPEVEKSLPPDLVEKLKDGMSYNDLISSN